MLFSLDHITFRAEYPEPSMHSHFAKHIIISYQNPLECIAGNDTIQCMGIVIQSKVPHTVKSSDGKMFVFLIDETCNLAYEMDNLYLKGKTYCCLSDAISSEISSSFRQSEITVEADEGALHKLGLCTGGAKTYDERITTVLDAISTGYEANSLNVSDFAHLACLSESRLSHMFREQVGITLSGYLVLAKIARAYQYLSEGTDITTAALKAGFSSSAHFAATAKKNFGISTSEVMKGTNPLSSLQ